ncbi:MAG: IPT/TIG domain-containing protein, partial [Bryobacteraceae bacterium]
GYCAFYISDFSAHRVYRLAQDGTLTTAAGTGIQGLSGDGAAAINAKLAYPAGLAVDRQGALYIADSGNHVIRKVNNGVISTFAHANTPAGLAIDGAGNLYAADPGAGEIVLIPANGPAAVSPISASDLALDFQGDLYATEPALVLRVALDGNSVAIGGGGSTASGDGGPATAARVDHPAGVAADAAGNFYIADRDNNRIRRVSVDGSISTVAGTGVAGDAGDGGPAIAAALNAPSAVSVDSAGDIFICDSGNSRVREIVPGGTILPVEIDGLKSPAYAIADASGNLYIADDGNGTILKRTISGNITILAENLAGPRGLALDSSGNLYFTEAGGPHVRRLVLNGDTRGNLTSIAEGTWNVPRGVAADGSGGVFVVDTGLQEIIHVDSSGTVAVVAGTGTPGLSGDGGPALGAALNFPWDIDASADGALYIADLENNRIRKLTPESAPPVLTLQALNDASRAPGPVAPGMLIDLAGTGLTSGTPQVLFDSTTAPVIALDSTRFLVEAPAQIAGRASVQIQVVDAGSVIAQAEVSVADSAPALYTSIVNQDGSVNSSSNPAPRGSIVSVYGTGQGTANLPVSVTIGGYSCDVLYAGPVAAYPGLFQINARTPSGFAPLGQLPVMVTVDQSSTHPGISVVIN